MRVVAATFLCAVAFALGGGAVLAQSTGGRMGGGDWSSPGNSSSSDHSSSSSSSRSSSAGWTWSSSSSRKSSTGSSNENRSSFWRSSSSSSPEPTYGRTYDYSRPDPPMDWSDIKTVAFVFGLGVTLVVLCVLLVQSGSSSANPPYTPSYVPPLPPWRGVEDETRPRSLSGSSVDVTVIRIALDGRARAFVQTELAQIADTSDTSAPEGRMAMLAQVSLLLRRLRNAWVYGGAHNEPVAPIATAKNTFDRHVDDARARYRYETTSNVQGTKGTADAPEISRRSDEGEGLILVSLVIAARAELFHVSRIGDGEDLRKALEAISYLDARELIAVEIVWMPSQDSDRMSSFELEAKYPRPLVVPIAGALVGKTFCAFCAGPFPAELVSCPHCGAPARERAA